MVHPLTVVRTLRHFSARLFVHQLRHRIRGPAQKPAQVMAQGCTGFAIQGAWQAPSVEGQTSDAGRRVSLFRSPSIDPIREGWQPPGRSPLWLYTLHYHGWINAPEADPQVVRDLLLNWIDKHRHGVGWEPYPTAMRILHWLAWLHHHRAILNSEEQRQLLASLAAQLQHLQRNIEYHLDGNHLWTDLVALTSAGLVLEGPLPLRLCRRWLPTLARVILDQVGADGVHRERTPSYHCLLTEQLSIVLSAMSLRTGTMPTMMPTLRGILERMSMALPAFTHADGDVALWGDSQLAAPYNPKKLAQRLGLPLTQGHANANNSGFYRRTWGPWTLLWNAGGSDFGRQVGHLHADALAIELSLGDERVLVDAGVGTYTIGADRDYSRSTAAHNTVTIGEDDRDQYELWASHRIGGRARVAVDEASPNLLRGHVRGYQWPVRHQRTIEWRTGVLRCHDSLSRPKTPATLRFFLPATVTLAPIVGGFRVTTAQGQSFAMSGPASLRWQRRDARGWSAIDQPSPRIALSTQLPAKGATIEF
ncbi:MAG TPA: alginate lyase family protein, partial [Nannocystis exedens]|nr:alginate lyase family protein [Nannocystis exedens]